MKKIILSIFLLQSAFMHVFAQSTDSSLNAKELTWKINPSQLIAGEIRILLERKISQRNSVEYVGSFYPPYSFIEMYDRERLFDMRIGFKTGIGYRHYYFGYHYIAPSFFYKFMYYDSAPWDVAESSISVNIGSYESNMSSNSHTTSMQKHIFSFQFDFGDKYVLSKHFIMDMYWGLGARLKYIREPRYIYSYSDWIEIRPSMQWGINLGYKK